LTERRVNERSLDLTPLHQYEQQYLSHRGFESAGEEEETLGCVVEDQKIAAKNSKNVSLMQEDCCVDLSIDSQEEHKDSTCSFQ
jgi:hypothetical protein